MSPTSRFCLALAFMCVLAPLATAQNWTGTVGGNWNTAGNWSPAGVPISGINTQLTFDATTHASMTDDIPNSFLLNRLAFNAGAPAYSLTGNALDFRKATGSILPSIGMDTSSAVSIANSIVLTSDLTVGGAGTGNLTLNGSLSGGGRLTYAGAGTLTLGASNSYTGGTFVNSGTLALSGLSGVLPPGLNVTIGNGSGPAVLNANNVSNNSVATAIGVLTLNGGGTFHAPGGLSAGTST